MTDTLELKAEIVRNGKSISKVAKEIGMSKQALSYKINNKRRFTNDDIVRITKVLNLTQEQMVRIFFSEVFR